MRRKPVILRCITFLLLIVFTQKAGAGLFIHNALHASSAKTTGHTEDKGFNYSCTCGDDFLIPFEAAEEISFSLTPQKARTLQLYFTQQAVSHNRPLLFLRGPPFITV